jgi:hypothetical protein
MKSVFENEENHDSLEKRWKKDNTRNSSVACATPVVSEVRDRESLN